MFCVSNNKTNDNDMKRRVCIFKILYNFYFGQPTVWPFYFPIIYFMVLAFNMSRVFTCNTNPFFLSKNLIKISVYVCMCLRINLPCLLVFPFWFAIVDVNMWLYILLEGSTSIDNVVLRQNRSMERSWPSRCTTCFHHSSSVSSFDRAGQFVASGPYV